MRIAARCRPTDATASSSACLIGLDSAQSASNQARSDAISASSRITQPSSSRSAKPDVVKLADPIRAAASFETSLACTFARSRTQPRFSERRPTSAGSAFAAKQASRSVTRRNARPSMSLPRTSRERYGLTIRSSLALARRIARAASMNAVLGGTAIAVGWNTSSTVGGSEVRAISPVYPSPLRRRTAAQRTPASFTLRTTASVTPTPRQSVQQRGRARRPPRRPEHPATIDTKVEKLTAKHYRVEKMKHGRIKRPGEKAAKDKTSFSTTTSSPSATSRSTPTTTW